MTSTAVAERKPQALTASRPLILKETLQMESEQRRLLGEFVKNEMVEGTDYGVIPGTEKKDKDGKPVPSPKSLLKPGAEKLTSLFRCVARFELVNVIRDFATPLFYFEYRCEIVSLDTGGVVAEGFGSANSHESKWRYRNADRACPVCEAAAIKRSKFPPRDNPQAPPGWYCFDKLGGCGANFPADDHRITDQVVGKVDNPDVADQANSIMKIAKKRCLGGNTPLLVRTDSGLIRTDVEGLWAMRQRSTLPMQVPGIDGDWRNVMGMVREEHDHVYRINLHDGSYIHASGDHRFPTSRGLLEVSQLRDGDNLMRSGVNVASPGKASLELGWIAGFYLAEGHPLKDGRSVRFTIGADEVVFAERIVATAEPLGARVTLAPRNGSKTLDVNVYGPAFAGLVTQFIDGEDCYSKHVSRFAFREGANFLAALLNGYIDGDGHLIKRPGRTDTHILGFTGQNRELAYDLRCVAAILGMRMRLSRGTAKCGDREFPTFTGWIKEPVESYNQANLEEIVSIKRENRAAVLYDIEVDGDHLFCLANGIQTHNSHVDAAITLARCSDMFTQDLDDDDEPKAAKPAKAEPKAETSGSANGTGADGPQPSPASLRKQFDHLVKRMCEAKPGVTPEKVVAGLVQTFKSAGGNPPADPAAWNPSMLKAACDRLTFWLAGLDKEKPAEREPGQDEAEGEQGPDPTSAPAADRTPTSASAPPTSSGPATSTSPPTTDQPARFGPNKLPPKTAQFIGSKLQAAGISWPQARQKAGEWLKREPVPVSMSDLTVPDGDKLLEWIGRQVAAREKA